MSALWLTFEGRYVPFKNFGRDVPFTNFAAWGMIPSMLSAHDERSAKEQINENYAHGGGWRSFAGFTLSEHDDGYRIDYPEDPSFRELGRAKLRDEKIVLFEASWVAIIQPDGTYEISRMD